MRFFWDNSTDLVIPDFGKLLFWGGAGSVKVSEVCRMIVTISNCLIALAQIYPKSST